MDSLKMIFALFFFTTLHTILAHNLQLEPQMVEPGSDPLKIAAQPWANQAGNSNFSNAMELGWTIGTSQIVFGYLNAHDVDFYKFTISSDNSTSAPYQTNDFEQSNRLFGAKNPVLMVSGLPPACHETVDNFPAVALLAKEGSAFGLVPAFYLPFEVPEGYRAFAMRNKPPNEGDERVVFNIPEEDGAEPLALSWFLPKGCSMEKPDAISTLDCTTSRSLVASIWEEDIDYYIAVWDPKHVGQDYSLNVGIDEKYYGENEKIEDAVRNNKYLHTECTSPYPDSVSAKSSCRKPQACSYGDYVLPEKLRGRM